MDSSSRAWLLALSAAAWLLPGCWTGRVYERGRIRESVLSYDRALLDGDRIRLEYSVELIDSNGVLLETGRRIVEIPRGAIAARPEVPVDAFPVEAIDPDGDVEGSGQPLSLVQECPPADPTAAPCLEVIAGHGRHRGFYLRTGAVSPEGFFRSEALYRDRTAWWVYLLLPFSAALDLALLPLQVVSVAPFFVVGD
jgi:hypothetical protein